MKLSKYTLIILPILELILFIEIGSFIGSLGVILSIIITMFLGYYLIKQKLRTIRLGLFNPNNFTNLYAFSRPMAKNIGFLTYMRTMKDDIFEKEFYEFYIKRVSQDILGNRFRA